MKIINGFPDNINALKFDIAKHVFNAWNVNLDIVTQLEVRNFTSNEITFIGKLSDLKKSLFDEMTSIPNMTPEIYQDVTVLILVFNRNETGWHFNDCDSRFVYWDISYKLNEWFKSGEKQPGFVFDASFLNCKDMAIENWLKESEKRIKTSFVVFRKGLALIYNSDLDENLKSIKEVKDKLDELYKEREKLVSRGKDLVQKICSMSEDF